MGAILVCARYGSPEAFFDIGYITIKNAAEVASDQEMFFPDGLNFALVRIMLNPGFEQNYR